MVPHTHQFLGCAHRRLEFLARMVSSSWTLQSTTWVHSWLCSLYWSSECGGRVNEAAPALNKTEQSRADAEPGPTVSVSPAGHGVWGSQDCNSVQRPCTRQARILPLSHSPALWTVFRLTPVLLGVGLINLLFKALACFPVFPVVSDHRFNALITLWPQWQVL